MVRPVQMRRPIVKPPRSEACLIAAEEVQRKLMSLRRKIERTGNPSVSPRNPLPVDIFLAEMATKVGAPLIIFEPRLLGSQIWTESVTAYVYAGIEQAFVTAGKLPGGNRSGHVRKLKELKAWVEKQEKDPSQKVPKGFVQETALLFSKGILKERRRERILTIQRIGYDMPVMLADLAQLKRWLEEDLADALLRQKGRPADYQKIVFAVEIANRWNVLTGRPMAKGPDTYFAQFLTECWRSGFVGFVGSDFNSNFKRTIRDHIEESKEPYECGRCEECLGGQKCERKRYYGTLN